MIYVHVNSRSLSAEFHQSRFFSFSRSLFTGENRRQEYYFIFSRMCCSSFFFFFFFVARMLRRTNSHIHPIIDLIDAKFLSLSRFLLYASKDEKENFSSLPLAQVDVSAALHLLLKQDDGSSNHRDKKVVCVCPNVEY